MTKRCDATDTDVTKQRELEMQDSGPRICHRNKFTFGVLFAGLDEADAAGPG